MNTYMMLMKFTTPGFESIKDGKAGRAAGKRAAKAMGINWKHQYLVMGPYDIITILEAPDDETIAIHCRRVRRRQPPETVDHRPASVLLRPR